MKQVDVMSVLCVSLLLLVAAGVQADVYRWIDGKGQVHYGDRSPKGATASKISMPAPNQSDTQTPPSEIDEIERRQRQKSIVETLSAERKARDDARQKKKDENAKKQAACERLRMELVESKSVNVYYRRNKKGERVYISDKERKVLDVEEEKKYHENCSQK